jgi:hypothetical protein
LASNGHSLTQTDVFKIYKNEIAPPGPEWNSGKYR